MRSVRIAIAGFGSVGRATADLLLARRERYRHVYGADVRLVAVCGSRAGVLDQAGLDASRFDALKEGCSGPAFLASGSPDILIEAGPSDFRTGGPGLPYIRDALASGRDAIVISKGALVHSGGALRDLAAKSGARLKVSGATAAALPTIDLLDYSLRGCTVIRIEGILNATTNYLLDTMSTRGIGFEQTLAEAQAGGFAESDPRNDIEGWDTACKLLILANFGLGTSLGMDDLTVEGIQAITRADLDAWHADGLVPKLVGRLNRDGDGVVEAGVGVGLYERSDPFALVSGKNKAIRITTDSMGDILAMGGGKEPTATASAALKDLEHILEARRPR